MVHVKQVVPIDLNGVLLGDAVSDGLVCEVGASELLFAGRGQSPGVVFDADDDGKLPHGSDVHGFVKVPLGSATVTGEHKRASSRAVELLCEGHTVGQTELGAEVADHAHDVVFRASEVEAAVPALGEAVVFALELGKESVQGHVTRGEDP